MLRNALGAIPIIAFFAAWLGLLLLFFSQVVKVMPHG